MLRRAGEVLEFALPVVASLVVLAVVANQVGPVGLVSRWAERPSPETALPAWLWTVVPLAASLGVAVSAFHGLRGRLVGLAAVVAVAAAVHPLGVHQAYYAGLALPFVLSAIAFYRMKRGRPLDVGLVQGSLLAAVLAVASYYRFAVLPGLALRDLDADAITFMSIAERSFIWNTDFREPLFIWMIKGMRLLSGEYSAPALRLFGIGLSLVTVAVLFDFVRRHIGLIAAVIAASLYAMAPAFVFSAPRGLREDTTITLFLLFCMVYLRMWNARPRLRDYLLIGFVLALNIGIRMSSNGFGAGALVMLFAWGMWRHRVSWRLAWMPVLALAIGLAPYIPFFVHCHKKYGDAFFSVNIIAKFYSNLEFAGRPGFPTHEELQINAFAGPPITMGEYMFGLLGHEQVMNRTLVGGMRLYLSKRWIDFPTVSAPWWERNGREWMFHFGDFNLQRQPLVRVMPGHIEGFLWLQTLGLLAMLLPGRRLFLFLVFAFHAPGLFLAAIPEFDWRLLTLAMASFYVGIGALAESALELARRLAALRLATVRDGGSIPAAQSAGADGVRRPGKKSRRV